MEKNVIEPSKTFVSKKSRKFKERTTGHPENVDAEDDSKQGTCTQILSNSQAANPTGFKLDKAESVSNIEPDNFTDDSLIGCGIRRSSRTKPRKVVRTDSWIYSDPEVSENDDDELYEPDDSQDLPRTRKRKKPCSSVDESPEKKIAAKIQKRTKKVKDATSDFSFKSNVKEADDPEIKESSNKVKDVTSDVLDESIIKEADRPFPQMTPPQSEKQNKVLHHKLTIDKDKNISIILSCGTKVQLKTDSSGKFVVPDGHVELSIINGKTLEQLVGAGKVVQKKFQKPKTGKHTPALCPATLLLGSQREVLTKNEKDNSVSVSASTVNVNSSSLTKTKKQEVVSSTGVDKNLKAGTSATVTENQQVSYGDSEKPTTKVQLKTVGKVVSGSHEGQAMATGKTEELLATGEIVQRKGLESKIFKHTSTSFLAKRISESERDGWMENVKEKCVSIATVNNSPKRIKKNPHVKSSTGVNKNEKVTSSADKVQKISSDNGDKSRLSYRSKIPEEIVIDSGESDGDSIEVITEAKPKKMPFCNNFSRIQPVGRNTNTRSFSPKPLTQSVTTTQVTSSPKPQIGDQQEQWKPVIANAFTLKTNTPLLIKNVRSPEKTQFVTTSAKTSNVERDSTHTSLPPQLNLNENVVAITSVPALPPESEVMPVTQVLSNLNQQIASSISITKVNKSSPAEYVDQQNRPQSHVSTTEAPIFINANDIGLSSGLLGRIVPAENGSNAFELDDGGLIFLSTDQISKIKAAIGDRNLTNVTFCAW